MLVHAPAGGRPGSALYPGAIDILYKLLRGFSGGLQLKSGILLGGRNGIAIIFTEILEGAIILLTCCLKTNFLNLQGKKMLEKRWLANIKKDWTLLPIFFAKSIMTWLIFGFCSRKSSIVLMT